MSDGVEQLKREEHWLEEELRRLELLMPAPAAMMWLARMADFHFDARNDTILAHQYLDLGLGPAVIEYPLPKGDHGVAFSLFDPDCWQWAFAYGHLKGERLRAIQLLQQERDGLISLDVVESDKRVCVRFPVAGGAEYIETQDWSWFLGSNRSSNPMPTREITPALSRQLSRIVGLSSNGYIRYETTEELENFFLEEANAAARSMAGIDNFPESASFGGIEFRLLVRAVILLIRRCVRHTYCCNALLEKKRGLDSRIFPTLWSTRNDLIAELEEELPREAAELAVSVLSATRFGPPDLSSLEDVPMPMIISLGRTMVITPTRSSLTNPFSLLTRQLMTHFERDYSKAVELRESNFRSDLQSLLNRGKRLLVLPNAVKLQGRRMYTDVDALVIDTEDGTVGIFQMKWQEMFGGAMRERRSRMRNLERESHKWIDAVEQWISEFGLAEMVARSRNRLPSGFVPKSYRLFVLGRYYASWSGGTRPSEYVAWINWASLVRLVEEHPSLVEGGVTGLYDGAITWSAGRRAANIYVPPNTNQLGRLQIDFDAFGVPPGETGTHDP